MTKIGDVFPEGAKREHIERRITPGVVLLLFCTFTAPPKDKFLALSFLGADKSALMLIINSKIHRFLLDKPRLLGCQVKMPPADYPFLSHDSYIDCTKIVDHFDYATIETQLLADITRIKDDLTSDTRRQIVAAVQSAPTVTTEQKRLIVEALQPDE